MVQHREGGSFGPAGSHGVVDPVAGQLKIDGGAGEKSDPGNAEQGGDKEDDIDYFPHRKASGDLAHEYGGDGHPRHPASWIQGRTSPLPSRPRRRWRSKVPSGRSWSDNRRSFRRSNPEDRQWVRRPA